MRKTVLILMMLCITSHAKVHQGKKVQNFSLPDIFTSKDHSISELKGNVILLNLWASWCRGCKKEMPAFFALQKEYKKGFKIVAVSLDDNPKKAKNFLTKIAAKKGYDTPFIVLHDTHKKVANAYNCEALPSSYLIDKHGIIQEEIVGSLDPGEIKELKNKINTLLK